MHNECLRYMSMYEWYTLNTPVSLQFGIKSFEDFLCCLRSLGHADIVDRHSLVLRFLMLAEGNCDRKQWRDRAPDARREANGRRCLLGRLPPRVQALVRRKATYAREIVARSPGNYRQGRAPSRASR